MPKVTFTRFDLRGQVCTVHVLTFQRSLYSPAPLSPLRSEEFDYQQSNITLLKAQLKLITHERDMLKKDVKRISQERDGAYRHLSLSASPQASFETSSHHRTNSDTAPSVAKSGIR